MQSKSFNYLAEGPSICLDTPLIVKGEKIGTARIFQIAPNYLIIESKLSKTINADDKLNIFIDKETNITLNAYLETLDKQNNVLIANITKIEDIEKFNNILTIIRKNYHIQICTNQNVEATDHNNGFSQFTFIPKSLPNLNFSDIDITTNFLHHSFNAPILITGMTGGTRDGAEINNNLSLAASKFNIPFGVGSQRIALEGNKDNTYFNIRKQAPDIFLIANIGVTLLNKSNYIELCQKAVELIDANALAIHLNIIQELIQIEGERNFKNLLTKIFNVTKTLNVPIIAKEVGSGLDTKTASQLIEAGVSALDIGGRGGTSWNYIDSLRASSKETSELGESFRDWGIPTAFSLRAIRKRFPAFQISATGGIRDGHTIAKSIALGANIVGIGLPLFRAATKGYNEVCNLLTTYIKGLKIVMMATESQNLGQLKNKITIGHPYEQEES